MSSIDPNAPGKNPNWQLLQNFQVSGQVQFVTPFDMVRMFHILGGLHQGKIRDVVTLDVINNRMRLIEEEYKEVAVALDDLRHSDNYKVENLAILLKELVDLIYQTMGAAVEFGLPLDSAFAIIHTSNVEKIKDEVILVDGKIQKPEGWKAPDLVKFLTAILTQDKMQEDARAALEKMQQKQEQGERRIVTPAGSLLQ
jgi:predicted HAD superfamily Cof-like phosphohydrolase